MITVPSPVEHVTIQRDLRRDTWVLSAESVRYVLRPWSCGERRRLVEAATSGGSFDPAVFLEGMAELLLDPVPEGALPAPLALACLRLLGVPEEGPVAPLARAEFLVTKAFGWRPREVDEQPAAAIDRLAAQLEPAHAEPPGDGWTRILVAADPPPGAERGADVQERLEPLFASVARWAGLTVPAARSAAPPPSPAPPPRPQPETSEPRPPEPRVAGITMRGTARLRPPLSPALRRNPATPRALPDIAAGAQPRTPMPDAAPSSHLRGPMPAAASGAPPSRPEPDTAPGLAHRAAMPDAASSARLRGPMPDAEPRARALPPGGPEPNAAPALGRPGAMPDASPSAHLHGSMPDVKLRARARDPMPAAASAPAPRPPGEPRPAEATPSFHVAVRWPEPQPPAAPASAPDREAPVPADPFPLSELEECMADVLDRAAREAGVDLP